MRTSTGYALAVTLSCFAPIASSQVDPVDELFRADTSCVRENSSRLCSACSQDVRDEIVITTEIQGQPIVVQLPDVVITDCEADISFEYTQRGAIARVKGEIENPTCAASAGSFTVSLRTSNDNFEQTTQEYHETWQRDDHQPVMFSHDYEIGDNVDLIRVRTLKSMCKCSVPAQ